MTKTKQDILLCRLVRVYFVQEALPSQLRTVDETHGWLCQAPLMIATIFESPYVACPGGIPLFLLPCLHHLDPHRLLGLPSLRIHLQLQLHPQPPPAPAPPSYSSWTSSLGGIFTGKYTRRSTLSRPRQDSGRSSHARILSQTPRRKPCSHRGLASPFRILLLFSRVPILFAHLFARTGTAGHTEEYDQPGLCTEIAGS
jgi:hypothetical protein